VYEEYGFALDGVSRERKHLGGRFREVRYRIAL
jgi:hypothetical protein